jgi:hypothetical protein
MQPACEFLCTLAGQAGQRVLRDVASHSVSPFAEDYNPVQKGLAIPVLGSNADQFR